MKPQMQVEGDRCNELDGIVGRSAAMRAVADLISKVASSGFAVLIRGESGTGKELIARSIQRNSQRVKGPFLPVNCGAIPGESHGGSLVRLPEGIFHRSVLR